MSQPNHPDPKAVRALRRRDPVLAKAMTRMPKFPGFPLQGGEAVGSHFQALARSIIFQQLVGAAARTIYGRVNRLTPGSRFPNARQILELPEEDLRGAGLSAGKFKSLRDLAARVDAKTLSLTSISRMDDADIESALTEVHGIGPWTAQMFLLFRLGRLDVMAPGDLAIQEGLKRLDGLAERPKPKALLERAEIWRPLRSVACWTLWRLTDNVSPD